jgi:hypothetical protein
LKLLSAQREVGFGGEKRGEFGLGFDRWLQRNGGEQSTKVFPKTKACTRGF